MKKIKHKKEIFLGIVILTIFTYLVWYYYNKDVIARVGSFKITSTEFEREMHLRAGKFVHNIDKEELLKEMIEEKLFLNKAYEMELDKKAYIQRRYDYMLIRHIRDEFIQQEKEKISLRKEDFQNYYEKHKKRYLKPQEDHFAILFFSKRFNKSEKRQLKVKEKFKKIQALALEKDFPLAKKGFGKYAIENSEHQVSRYKGGVIGWFVQDAQVFWEEKVLNVGFKLHKVGDISNLVETEKGYYLIRLLERKASYYEKLEKVENRIRHALILEKQAEIEHSFKKKLSEKFEISINLDSLKDINQTSTLTKRNETSSLPFNRTLN